MEQVFRQDGVQILKGEGIEPNLVGLFDEHFDGRLVVQDHLGFLYVFTLCCLTEFDQDFKCQDDCKYSPPDGKKPMTGQSAACPGFVGHRCRRGSCRQGCDPFHVIEHAMIPKDRK